MGIPINLQDAVLRQAIKEKMPVTIFLTNGFQFKGVVCGFDSYVVLIECDGMFFNNEFSFVFANRIYDDSVFLN